MGYFSNGTEGEMYYERWCENCVHDRKFRETGVGPGCPVWSNHLLHSTANQPKHILHSFIPRSKDGIGNEKCLMFVPDKAEGISELERSE